MVGLFMEEQRDENWCESWKAMLEREERLACLIWRLEKMIAVNVIQRITNMDKWERSGSKESHLGRVDKTPKGGLVIWGEWGMGD